MDVIRTKAEIIEYIHALRKNKPDITVGFVPTMGYLHAGHSTLIERCHEKSDFTVVSIYVNPTQFGPGEDFERYPRDEARDLDICARHGTNVVFLPDSSQIYAEGHSTFIRVRETSDVLCGQFRPGHFEGVATIVAKLFNIIRPDVAFFGQKDAQQVVVIRKMTRELDIPVRIEVIPTIREPDGLALSSRNVYLSVKGREIAPEIHRALMKAQTAFSQSNETDSSILIALVHDSIAKIPEFQIQYIEIRSFEDLQPMPTVDRPAILAIAVYLEKVRLIDNLILNPENDSHD